MYGTRDQVVLPLNLETKIKGDDPVFKLAEKCDTLDYTELYKAYVRTYRKYDPAMLFIVDITEFTCTRPRNNRTFSKRKTVGGYGKSVLPISIKAV